MTLKQALRSNSILFILSFILLSPALVLADTPPCFDLKWGTNGTSGNGFFNYPSGVAQDMQGYLYVTDTNNHRIQKFDTSGNYVSQWGSNGGGNGQFNYPSGIAVDNSSNTYSVIYVADRGNDRVQVFNTNGGYIGGWGSTGPGSGQFNSPYGIAVDSSGFVYVMDTYNFRVQKFDSAGAYQAQWGTGPGAGDMQFTGAFGIAAEGSSYIYTIDSQNNRIQKFTTAGAFVLKWGAAGNTDGTFANPVGIAVDNIGSVYAADSNNNRMQKFDTSGGFLAKWGIGQGSADGQFYYPWGICCETGGKVYVADTYNHRVQKFITCAATPTPTACILIPFSHVTHPSDGSFTNSVTYISGTALAACGNVTQVDVSVYSVSLSQYWTGAGWQVGQNWVTVAVGTGWSFAFTPPSDGQYIVRSRAHDSSGNTEVPDAGITFGYDTSIPISAITSPSHNVYYNAIPPNFTGSAADTGAGVGKVRLSLYSLTNDVYWDGAGWIPFATQWFDAAGSTSWFYSSGNPGWTSGRYSLLSEAVDNAGNTQNTAVTGLNLIEFVFDNTPPASTVSYPINSSTLPSLTGISGTVTENTDGIGLAIGGDALQIYIYNLTDNTYFNGSVWDAPQTWLNASVACVTCTASAWDYPVSDSIWTPGKIYQIMARGKDQLGNVEASGAWANFTFMPSTPTPTPTVCAMPSSSIIFPVNGQNYNPVDIGMINGVGSAPCGFLTAERISIERLSDLKWWDGSGFSMVSEWWNFGNVSAPNWNYTNLPPWQPGESYYIRWKAQDDHAQIENPGPGITIHINMPPVLNLSQYKSVSVCAGCGSNITYTLNYSLVPKPPANPLGAIYSAPATKLVGQGQTYVTITQAMNTAAPGDVIEVEDSGIYEEQVSFLDIADTAGVILRAKPGQHPEIVAPQSVAGNDLIDIGYNCTIAGFTIDGRFIADHGVCQNNATAGYKVDRCFVKNCRGAGINLWVVGYANGLASYPSTYITNCVVANNGIDGSGSGINFDQGVARPGMSVNVWNCTLYGNYYPAFVNSVNYEYDIRNCVMRGNANPIYTSTDKSNISYSIIEQSATGYGPGCINTDPVFANGASGNFHILSGSQAIDSGSAAVSSNVIYDMDFRPRPVNGSFDMGAYEYDAVNASSVAGMKLWDTIPADLSLVSASAGYTMNGAMISWNIASLFENDFSGSKYFIAAPVAACPVMTPVFFGNMAWANHSGDLTPVPANPEFVSLCLVTPTPAPATLWRIRAGGSAPYVDGAGNTWTADACFNNGTATASGNTISGTPDQALYQTERFGNPFTYIFPMQPGTYKVTLKFAEMTFNGPGQRIFDVYINGVKVLAGYDIYSTAGGANQAHDEVFTNIGPDSGFITIQFGPASVDNAKIDAIEIIAEVATPTFTPTPTMTVISTFTATPTMTRTNTVLPTLTSTVTPSLTPTPGAPPCKTFLNYVGDEWLGRTFPTENGVATGLNNYTYVVMQSQVLIYDEYGFYHSAFGSTGFGNGGFNTAMGIAIASSGDVYIADQQNNLIQVFDALGTFITQWGGAGAGDGQLNQPDGVAVDSAGNIYVADTSNHRIQKFTSGGVFVTKWGSLGTGNGLFDSPQTLACDAAGNVYVTDTNNSRIEKFTSAGIFITAWGISGSADGQMINPHGISVDPNGFVAVNDRGNNRVIIFDSAGAFIRNIGTYGTGNGELNNAQGLAFDNEGMIIVADKLANRLEWFDINGNYIKQVGNAGSSAGLTIRPVGLASGASGFLYAVGDTEYYIKKFNLSGSYVGTIGTGPGNGDGNLNNPRGMAADLSGNVYIIDQGNERIEKFSPAGAFLLKFGSAGTGNGKFTTPEHIAVDAAGNIYVTDSDPGLNRVQKFSAAGAYLAQWGSLGSGDGQFNSPQGITADPAGNIYVADRYNLRVQKFTSAGVYLAQWSVPGEPVGIAADASGNIWVTDTDNNNIIKYSPSGTMIDTIAGGRGSEPGKYDFPGALAVSASGDIYAADFWQCRVAHYYCSMPAATFTATPTYTSTYTMTQSQTFTQTITMTYTGTPSASPTFTGTKTYTPTATPTYTQTRTNTPTSTATQTNTPSAPSVDVYIGTANPAASTHIPGDSNVAVLQFAVHNTAAEPISFSFVAPQASGTGNDQSGITFCALWADNNANGVHDGGDLSLQAGTYPADNGTLLLNSFTPEIIPAGETRYYLLGYAFSPSAPLGTYSLSLPGNSNIGGSGQTTGLQWNITNAWPLDSSVITLAAPTMTVTPTFTATYTFTKTSTMTFTPTFTATPTGTDTNTFTFTPTATATGTDTGTATASPTYTQTGTYTATPTSTGTKTATPTYTDTPLPTDTYTVTPTWTITQTATVTSTFTDTPTPYVDIAIDRNYVQPGNGETVNIKVKADSIGVEVTAKIYNLTGEFLREIKYTTTAVGWNDINWDVKNAAGKTVGQGIYFIHIKNGSQSVIRKIFVLK